MEKLKQILSYVFPIIGGLIVFFITNKEESDTKFHAIQSIVLGLSVAIVEAICKVIPFVGGIIGGLCGIVFFALTIIAIVKIVIGQEPELPLFGEITQSVLKNI